MSVPLDLLRYPLHIGPWSCLCPTLLFSISCPPFIDFGLCGYETSLCQFHSRHFPDRGFFYSLPSFEPLECLVCGQGEPEEADDGHEEGF